MAEPRRPSPPAVELRGPSGPGFAEILTPEAVTFVADLQARFGPRRAE
ncbi:MAG: Malate synthase, partial [Solirubrobacteraceae bacterium]|nr:Malate synthase [Solirubrobacteraceae bacterium]